MFNFSPGMASRSSEITILKHPWVLLTPHTLSFSTHCSLLPPHHPNPNPFPCCPAIPTQAARNLQNNHKKAETLEKCSEFPTHSLPHVSTRHRERQSEFLSTQCPRPAQGRTDGSMSLCSSNHPRFPQAGFFCNIKDEQ